MTATPGVRDFTCDIGDAPTLYWNLYTDPDKTSPTDATVVLTVKAPYGTTSTPSVIHDGTGQYRATVEMTAAGTWTYRWSATGEVLAADEGRIIVRESGVL